MEDYDYKNKYSFDEVNDNLGEGGFGIVYKALIKNTDEKRAIKIINKNKIRENFKKEYYKVPKEEDMKPYFEALKNEITFMKIMEGDNNENENTVKFYEHFEYYDRFVIVMELCDTNLLDFLSVRDNFKVEEIREILTQLNKAFKIMHKNRISHRDLSLENILVKFKNKEHTKFILKLTDYGISKKLLSLSKKFSTKAGKLQFMAPEILNITKKKNEDEIKTEDKDKNKYDEECDLWSLGVIIHILFFKEHPYSGETETAIKKGIDSLQKEGIADTKDDLLNDLLRKLLDKNPKNRIKWKDYFEHPFFKNNYVLITISIEKKDKKGNDFKDIYFLDNQPYLITRSEIGKYKENEELINLNDNDVELYINNVQQKKFSKYFKPNNEGNYEIKIIFKKKITDCSFMFSGCDNIQKIDLSSFDSSDVKNMHYMFGKCHYLKEIILDNLNTENVTDMSHIFNACSKLEKIKFPKNVNTKNVKNIGFMFNNCFELNEISFGDFNTDNVKNMKGLFNNCFKLEYLDISKFNNSNVNDMSYMFNHCHNLKNLIINPETFISKETKNMAHMFDECNNLESINLSFNTEEVKYLSYMFRNCTNLKNLDLSSLNILDDTDLTYMFEGCCNFEKLDLSSLNIGDKNKINNMFDKMTKIKEIKVNENSINTFKKKCKEVETKFRTN